jgi:hypothetical protein
MNYEQAQKRNTATATAVFFLLLGAGVLAFGGHLLSLKSRLDGDAQTTMGLIRMTVRSRYSQAMSYQYEVNGRKQEDMGPMLGPVGAMVSVRYSRSNPALSRPGDTDFGHLPWLIGGGLVAALGLFVLVSARNIDTSVAPALSDEQEFALIIERAKAEEAAARDRAA